MGKLHDGFKVGSVGSRRATEHSSARTELVPELCIYNFVLIFNCTFFHSETLKLEWNELLCIAPGGPLACRIMLLAVIINRNRNEQTEKTSCRNLRFCKIHYGRALVAKSRIGDKAGILSNFGIQSF